MTGEIGTKCKLLIVGDFNFHYESSTDPDTNQLKEIIDVSNLEQFVTSPTHISGHVLDLIIARASDNLVESVKVDCLLTDHAAIHCKLNLDTPRPMEQHISYRKLKTTDHADFSI